MLLVFVKECENAVISAWLNMKNPSRTPLKPGSDGQ